MAGDDKKPGGITFKLLQNTFNVFCNEELNEEQLNTMTTVCNYLNAVDKTKRNNGGVDYKLAMLDKVFKTELPPAPASTKPVVREPEPEPAKEEELDAFDSENVQAEVDLRSDIELTVLNDNTVQFRMEDSDAIAGTVTFNNVSMSKKLAWFEQRFLIDGIK